LPLFVGRVLIQTLATSRPHSIAAVGRLLDQPKVVLHADVPPLVAGQKHDRQLAEDRINRTTPPGLDDAALIVLEAWELVVSHVEESWQQHLV
jgi:hypothetical protein